jgi:hypothetical protein
MTEYEVDQLLKGLEGLALGLSQTDRKREGYKALLWQIEWFRRGLF